MYHFEKEIQEASSELEIEWVDQEDPMIIHYTSGSTGKPKGVLHVHHAMIQHYQTGKWVLDLQEDEYFLVYSGSWLGNRNLLWYFCSLVTWSDQCDSRRAF